MMPSNKSKTRPTTTTAKPLRFDFEAIGTIWSIELFDVPADIDSKELHHAVMSRIQAFDKNYSRFRPDSWISKIAKKAGVHTMPNDARPLFDIYQQLYRITDGAVTPLIGQALADAGYDADYSLEAGLISPPPPWDEALIYDFPTLQTKQPLLLDVGAAGKGYLVDIIAVLLEEKGLNHYCVNAGGDMAYHTPDGNVLEVALEHPADPQRAIGIVRLNNSSICGSSGNRRAWRDYHHILDPHSLQSPRHLAAVWVVAADTMTADALATALFFASPETLLQHYSFEYAIVTSAYELRHSPKFPADFFTTQSSETIS